MCGIFGRFNFRSRRPASRKELETMARIMGHRGPDGEGFFERDHLGLGHKRLAIIDLEGGRQPMHSPDGALSITYNGEVFNYLEIFRDVEARGLRPQSQSDTEAILLAYQAYGLDFVHKLNGMFAFALWDEKARRLVLVRDRMGVKPLYYAHTPDGIVFASELKALRCCDGVDGSLDLEAFDDFMTIGYVVHPRSIARGVRKLDPGTMLIIEEDKEPSISTYWRLQFRPDDSKSEATWSEEVKALFEDSVRLRLRSDVPLGVLLSGGVDSTAIATTLAKIRGSAEGINSYTVGVDTEGAVNEFKWAKELADRIGTTHHEVHLSPDENGAYLLESSSLLDEPLAEPMIGQLYAICREARKKVTVLLSGEGSDETWLGYYAYRSMYAVEMAQRLVPAPILAGARPLVEAAAAHLPIPAKVLKHLRNATEPLERRYLGLNYFDPVLKTRMYAKSTREALASRDARETMRALYDDAGGPETMSRMAAVDCRGWLVDNTLARSDLMSMAASLELRVPFMDYRLVELACRIPARHKVKPHSQKWILKRALADRIPESVQNRKKLGFPTPLKALFRGPWGHKAEEVLSHPTKTSRDLFDRAVIHDMFRDHREGRNDFSMPLAQLLMFEHWSARADALSSEKPA